MCTKYKLWNNLLGRKSLEAIEYIQNVSFFIQVYPKVNSIAIDNFQKGKDTTDKD